MARPLNGPSPVTGDFGLLDDFSTTWANDLLLAAYLPQRFSGDQGVLVVTTPTLYVLVALDDLLRAPIAELEPGVLGRGGEERLQVVAPLSRRGLVRFDAGVVTAVEQQRPRLDLGGLRQ